MCHPGLFELQSRTMPVWPVAALLACDCTCFECVTDFGPKVAMLTFFLLPFQKVEKRQDISYQVPGNEQAPSLDYWYISLQQ